MTSPFDPPPRPRDRPKPEIPSVRTLVELNGRTIETRSILEAKWITALTGSYCQVECYECRVLKVIQQNRTTGGLFVGTYKPDLMLLDFSGQEVLVEIKPTFEEMASDDRPTRALVIQPNLRFLVLGGYPDGDFHVRMVSAVGERTFRNVSLPQLLELLGCWPVFRGVTRRGDGKWQARIQVDGKRIHIGTFGTPEEAARAYDAMARELLGDKAILNFP